MLGGCPGRSSSKPLLLPGAPHGGGGRGARPAPPAPGQGTHSWSHPPAGCRTGASCCSAQLGMPSRRSGCRPFASLLRHGSASCLRCCRVCTRAGGAPGGPGGRGNSHVGLFVFLLRVARPTPLPYDFTPGSLREGFAACSKLFLPVPASFVLPRRPGGGGASGCSPRSHLAPFAGVAPLWGFPGPPREPSASPAALPALPQALCAAVTTSDLAETQALLFCGAAVTCATGDPQCPTPLALAEKSGQRLQMEFLLHNRTSGKG